MSPKRIIVQNILCIWGTGDDKKTAGFHVSGRKELKQDGTAGKVGFILTGVKLVSFQQIIGTGIRTRVKWIPTGFEIREEIHPLNGVVVDIQRRNNVIFVNAEDNSVVVMQGEPTIKEKTFIGQILQIRWDEIEIQISPLQKQSTLHCVLNPRNNRIDCLVQ